jgi:hypothetical protein
MDPLQNPFTPSAGATPPALVGRDELFDSYQLLLDRLRGGYAERSLLVTGLRGVGKTVLLSEFARTAAECQWIPIETEVATDFPFERKMVSFARRALLQISPKTRWTERVKRAAAILRSFSLTLNPDGSLTASLNVDALEGVGDSGFLDDDLSDLFVAIGEAALEHDMGVVFLFDELQFLKRDKFESVVVALHKVVQRGLPLTLVGAGLPQLASLAGEARSYAERLFRFQSIGRLTEEETFAALSEPVDNLGVRFGQGALERVYRYTEGYPYFIQEYGRALWDMCDSGIILSTDVEVAEHEVRDLLDSSFFKVRTDKLNPDELSVLRGMAEIGDGPIEMNDILKQVKLASADYSDILERLSLRSMVYSPRFGYYDFAVPHFASYLRRRFPFNSGRVIWKRR